MQDSGRGNLNAQDEARGKAPTGSSRHLLRRGRGAQPSPGRGADSNPPNRFEPIAVERVTGELARYFEDPEPGRRISTTFYEDHTRTILAKNESPDIQFAYSLNPYRGCEHGCVYCYARPTHEYLGFSSGLDFESKIVVKRNAPVLLEQQFRRRSWKPQPIMMSGDTDCYQPVEQSLGITRGCLEVFLRYRHPLLIVTKNALIQRDIDLLRRLAEFNLVAVTISITSLDRRLIRIMEPRSSSPERRLETIEVLASAGIPVGVHTCPIIPALNDEEIPSILQRASARGARHAGYTIVRLPYAVKDLFVEWLNRELPERASSVLNRIRSMREGKLTCSDFGLRMNGEGQMAGAIEQLFRASCTRYHLNESKFTPSTAAFYSSRSSQMEIF